MKPTVIFAAHAGLARVGKAGVHDIVGKLPGTMEVVLPRFLRHAEKLIRAIIEYDLAHFTDTAARFMDVRYVNRTLKAYKEDTGEGEDDFTRPHRDDDDQEFSLPSFLRRTDPWDSGKFEFSRGYIISDLGGTVFENDFVAPRDQVIAYTGADFHHAPTYAGYDRADLLTFDGSAYLTRRMLRVMFRDAELLQYSVSERMEPSPVVRLETLKFTYR